MVNLRKMCKVKKMMIPESVRSIELYDPLYPGLAAIGGEYKKTPGDIKKRFNRCLRTKGRWIHRGRGEDAGYFAGRYPTHEEMDLMDKYVIPCDVDPDIREVILDINKAGFKTLGSCSGHPRSIPGHGFVSIKKDIVGIFPNKHVREPSKAEKDKIAGILREHGLTGIKYINPGSWYGFEFNSVGKRMCARRKKR